MRPLQVVLVLGLGASTAACVTASGGTANPASRPKLERLVPPDPPPDPWPEAALFDVVSIQALEARDPPDVREAADHVEVTSPSFEAYATVECKTRPEDGWAVGFVQAVLDREQVNVYPRSTTTWELRPLPLSDSDGTYPWYSESARVMRCGGTAHLWFQDAPWTRVLWDEWHPEGTAAIGGGTLQRYRRTQSFRVWLVALHVPTDRVVVLKELDWRFGLEIAFDTSRPVGSRGKVERVEFPDVVVRDGDPSRPVPPAILRPPRANDADELWWNPAEPLLGVRTRLKPPVWGPR